MVCTTRRLWLVLAVVLTSLSAVAQVATATLAVGNYPEAVRINTVTNRLYVVNSQCYSYPCSTQGTVTVLDANTHQTLGTVTVGYAPGDVVVNSVTNKVFVANTCGDDPTCQGLGTVTVIDGVTLQTSTVTVGHDAGNSIHGLALNPVTDMVYVANRCIDGGFPTCHTCTQDTPNGTITAINGSTLQPQSITVGCGPTNIGVDTQRNIIYVENVKTLGSLTGTLTVINGSTLAIQSVNMDYISEDVVVDANANKIYVSNLCGTDINCVSPGTITVVDGATLNTQSVTAGFEPSWEAVNATTHNLYLANSCGDSSCVTAPNVTVLNGGTLNTTTVPVCSAGQFPGDMEVNAVTNKTYTPCEDYTDGEPPGQTVYVIDGATNSTFPIAVGDQPNNSEVDSVHNLVYTANTVDNTISVIGGATKLQLNAVTPCRLVDTRTGNPIQGGATQTFNLPQLAQAQCTGLDLSAAASYSLNVTLLPKNGGRVRYLTIWPASQLQPAVSTMNSDGRNKADAAIVSAGVSGGVNVFVTDTADVLIDIDGYFGPSGPSTLQFYPVTPCRIVDTRNAPGDLGGPSLTGGSPRSFPLLEATTCFPQGVNPSAYSLNFTALPHGPLGYVTVWPTGETQPQVSTINAPTGANTANAAIVPAGTEGGVSVFASADTDLLVDVNGYFAPPGAGGLSLYPTPPCRVLDTRNGNGAFSGLLSPPIDVLASPCGAPSQSLAYTLNATVVPPGGLGYLTLWPDGQDQPTVSTLNAHDGAVTSNMAIVPAGTDGKIDAYAGNGTTNLILDISAFFAP
jgi:DNA-binding beta-propeller fold protein YncE